MIKLHLSTKRSIQDDRGLTLVEVMLAIMVLAFAGLGLVKVTYQMRVTAEDNIHQSTAYVIAQGYLEQICRLPYFTTPPIAPATYSIINPSGLQDIADDTTKSVPILIVNSAGKPMDGQTGDPPLLYNNAATNGGAPFSEVVYLDKDGTGNPTYPMTFTMQPVITDIDPTQLTTAGVEITVYFTESYVLAGLTRTFQSSVRTVYGNVATR
ncbi:MAG TPA: prepilin-type N-terminal cleavage/methylation domain-containing protein [Opitutaceae bacterium]|nr:prepilin-type N-terminal cleavage/methylation domain-containing protein [Opitutaceae bacterium]